MAVPQRESSVPTAVLYCRVSSQEQVREGISLAAQEEQGRAYCRMRGLHLAQVVVDPGVSAGLAFGQRPGGQTVQQLVAAGAVQAIVAWRLDRLFRDTAECLTVTREWDASGVGLHLLDMGGQSVDTTSATGRLLLTMLAAVAEMERSLLRERVQLALAHLADQGVYYSGQVPYGYRRVIAEGAVTQYLEQPAEADVVRALYARFVAGATMGDLQRWLMAAGIPSRKGHAWTTSGMRVILSNPIYIGMLPTGRKTFAEPTQAATNVVPLVPVETWKLSRAILRANQERFHPRSRGAAAEWGGLLVCGACEGQLVATNIYRPVGGSGEPRVWYRCNRARIHRCEQPSITSDVLWAELQPLLVDRLDPRRLPARQRRFDRERETAQRELLEVNGRLDRLAEVYSYPGSQMTPEDFQRQAQELWARRDRLQAAQRVEPAVTLPHAANRRELRQLLTALSGPDRRALLHSAIRSITILDQAVAAVKWSESC